MYGQAPTKLGSSWGYHSAVTATCQHNWPKLKQAKGSKNKQTNPKKFKKPQKQTKTPLKVIGPLAWLLMI